ncbi:hypothetical protein [Gemmatimonas sp.]|uniref:hypothetical protein n=1 Tax=Gemmatimonas sp. TaxID=1962908 RepID=UPI0037BE8E0B
MLIAGAFATLGCSPSEPTSPRELDAHAAVANGTAGTQNNLQVGDRYGGGVVAYIFQPGDPGYIADRVVTLPDGGFRESGPGITGDGDELGSCGLGGSWVNPSGGESRSVPHMHCRRALEASRPHGIIAAEIDQTINSTSGYYPLDRGVMWQQGIYVPAEQTTVFDPVFSLALGLGDGAPNTRLIMQTIEATGRPFAAARLAVEYRGGGYADWVLPSRDELRKLWISRVQIGGFQLEDTPGISSWYWSSSEYQESSNPSYPFPAYVWALNFASGGDGPGYKGPGGTAYKVRAIRYF